MNEPQRKERELYPRYQIVEGEKLEQGDILLRCPVVVPIQVLMWPVPEDHGFDVDALLYDLVVLTQSCDLELRMDEKTKVESYGVNMVTLCPHWDLSNVTAELSELAKKAIRKRPIKTSCKISPKVKCLATIFWDRASPKK